MPLRLPYHAHALIILLIAIALGYLAAPAMAQVDPTPTQRQLRTYIPPDQLVSFSASTPFNQFIEFVNPLFQRVTGKSVVDLTERQQPIGINVSGLQFLDAFELVLAQSGLTFRETDRYFLVEPATAEVARVDGAPGARPVPAVPARPAVNSDQREIRIDAIIFEANVDRLREFGTQWSTVLGEQGGSGGGGGGGTGGQQQGQLRLFLNTSSLFDSISDIIIGPDQVDLAQLNSMFRLLEARGVGETIASPSIIVRSGQQGRIQSGSDIPVTLQDFAGNTITQYIPTGVIITVTPVLVTEDEDPEQDPIEFVHLVVNVERSAGRLGGTGIIIDKNQAATDVFLLDGEQTVIGGLYSTEESVSRRGIPILMDIPILQYLFSINSRSVIERELIIVLQTRLIDPLRARASRPFRQGLVPNERRDAEERIRRAQPQSEEYFQELPRREERPTPVPPPTGDQ